MRLFVSAIAACVLAWAGAGDEASAALETLSTRFTAFGPAEIWREPFYTFPLVGNPHFKRLAAELEAQIAANQVILP